MFGLIVCNRKVLTKEEQERYQAVYCGLCRAIKKRYGQIERLSLNYDMTFLSILLNGLYEENNDSKEMHCPLHPLQKRRMFENQYIDYAADMTILLAYYKCKDDWKDEAKKMEAAYGTMLEKHVGRIEEIYPRQVNCVKKSIERLNQLENSSGTTTDEIVNCSGKMLTEIFVYQEDFWSGSLRKFGYELGRFVYLMDAALDYDKDKKKRTFNPLFGMHKKPDEIEPLLVQAIGNAAMEFEKLPIIQDVNLIRNILYGGVWQQYYAKVKRKEEGNDK